MVKYDVPWLLGLVLVAMTTNPRLSRAAELKPPPTPESSESREIALPEPPVPKTSSGWLRKGEAHQLQGELVEAGESYRRALETLSEKKQRADEGGRAALLSADAYVQAFAQDTQLGHLDASLAVLEHWLSLTGPQSQSALVEDVQRMVARQRAIREPLAAAQAAAVTGDYDGAAQHYRDALGAISLQEQDWATGAGIALQASDVLLVPPDVSANSPEENEPAVNQLETTRGLLAEWMSQRPTDDTSARGEALAQRLAELTAELEAVRKRERELAQEKAAAAQRVAAAQAEVAPSPVLPVETAPSPKRALPISLLSVGVVAAAAGASMLGEGIAFTGISRDRLAAERDEADLLSQMSGADYDRTAFDSESDDYEADVRRRNLGMIIGGSVVLAGGLAAAAVGVAKLTKNRRARGSRASAHLVPSFTARGAKLSLSTRF